MTLVDQERTKVILEALKNIQYGSLTITIHDGAITQIDRTEKTRFELRRSSTKNQRV
ncbi:MULTISPECIES: YezD family protein [unclassified Bacillus (in: firmicutes)]|uniref:YezD family protein n=1 Tax=unclassified Bacillus (in: firmicutes) TaxID=185979 RepID=UPI001596EC5C|nr:MULTISPECIES: YezD family protein [unclassified Bacillus (in: firmicutes)]